MKNAESSSVFAYLSIVGSVESGLIGGLLLLDERGRPLEFHCTSPIVPNRAQIILYGPTLRAFVVGEQLSVALLHKSKLKPVVVWTDDSDVLECRSNFDFPILVMEQTSGPNSSEMKPGVFVTTAPNFDADVSTACNWIADSHLNTQPFEPFERIREAVSEAFKNKAVA